MIDYTQELKLEELRRENNRLRIKEKYFEIINDFSFSLIGHQSLDDLLWSIAKDVVAKMDLVDCVIYLYDKKNRILVQRAAHGKQKAKKSVVIDAITIPIGKGIVGSVAQLGVSEIIKDTRKDNRYIQDDAFRLSEISVPIKYNSEILGVIDSEHPDPNYFTEEHLSILNTIAAISASKIVHTRALDDLKEHKKQLEEEVKEKTNQLEKLVQNLKRSNSDLEQFAHAVSHDLKEPLRTICGFMGLVKKKEKDSLSTEGLEFIDLAIGGGIRMQNLLEGLLSYSKVSVGDERKLLSIKDLLEEVKANLDAQIKRDNATVVFEGDSTVFGNPIQLSQLFQNLLSNAIKFSKKDQAPFIHISSKKQGNRVHFEFKDHGIGIAKECQERVFDLFSKGNASSEYEGDGIGLSLCKKIVEQHNGAIYVKSQLGKGTIFYFSLPA